MGMTNDPDETAVLDIAVARRHLRARLAADGTLCHEDRAALQALDAPVAAITMRVRARRALEACLRNGLSYYTRTIAKDAGIAFVTQGEQVTDVVQLPLATHTNARTGRNDPSAA